MHAYCSCTQNKVRQNLLNRAKNLGPCRNLAEWVRLDSFGRTGLSADKLTHLFRICDHQDVHSCQTPFENGTIQCSPACQGLQVSTWFSQRCRRDRATATDNDSVALNADHGSWWTGWGRCVWALWTSFCEYQRYNVPQTITLPITARTLWKCEEPKKDPRLPIRGHGRDPDIRQRSYCKRVRTPVHTSPANNIPVKAASEINRLFSSCMACVNIQARPGPNLWVPNSEPVGNSIVQSFISGFMLTHAWLTFHKTIGSLNGQSSRKTLPTCKHTCKLVPINLADCIQLPSWCQTVCWWTCLP